MKQLWKALMMVREADRGSFGRRVVYTLLQSVLPLISLWLLKQLVDAVAAGVRGEGAMGFMPWLAGLAGVFLIGRVVGALERVNADVLRQRTTDYMADLLQRQASQLDLAYFDTPTFHDTYHRAQQEAGSRQLSILEGFMAVGGSLLTSIGVVLMLMGEAWWIVVAMVVAVGPMFAVRLYKAQSIYRFRRSNTQLYRLTAYYGRLLTARESAAEMRVYGLSAHFRRLFVESRFQLVKRLLHLSRRIGVADAICGVVETVAMIAVVGLLAMRTAQGMTTVGSFVMLFEAFRRGQGYLNQLAAGVASLYDCRLFVGNLFEFLRLRPTILSPSHPTPMPERIESVELRDISFRYPGMQRDVLSHYSFVARRGELTRIEGENGRGKSTVLRLLLRLYDPQQGTVLINGIDVRSFRVEELRRTFGVLFQDFMRYQATLDENIALGAVDASARPLDEAKQQSGAAAVAALLTDGGSTRLGRLFDGGSELSMGQWQRVALARALQSDAPVLLLDEPFAWQDAESRQHLMQTIDQLKDNKIVILITHA